MVILPLILPFKCAAAVLCAQVFIATLAMLQPTCSAVPPSTNTKRRCSPAQLNHRTGLKDYDVQITGKNRRFVLYMPRYFREVAPVPLWLVAPGTFNGPRKQIAMSEMVNYAEHQQFAFAALKGDEDLMNVVLRARDKPGRPDDVAYTAAVINASRQNACIDAARIYCAGYSRGARFCARLASELSEQIAAIAAISGIRFPLPNNATRPVPILAFHGTKDPVNPYKGHGNPEYWDESVQDAISQWVQFNGCTRNTSYTLGPRVVAQRHSACRGHADVELVKIEGGGHVWPGSDFNWEKELGYVTQEVDASRLVGAFFAEHPLPDGHIPVPTPAPGGDVSVPRPAPGSVDAGLQGRAGRGGISSGGSSNHTSNGRKYLDESVSAKNSKDHIDNTQAMADDTEVMAYLSRIY